MLRDEDRKLQIRENLLPLPPPLEKYLKVSPLEEMRQTVNFVSDVVIRRLL